MNKFLADNPNLDRDLRLKILENVDRHRAGGEDKKQFPAKPQRGVRETGVLISKFLI